MKKIIQMALVVIGIGTLGGCAATLFDYDDPRLPTAQKCRTSAVETAKDVKGIEKYVVEIDLFLDCYVGKIEGDPKSEKVKELKLFRGHVIVTLLARYGAFNITGKVEGIRDIDYTPYPGIDEDAADILAGIEEAEIRLRRASKIFKDVTQKLDRPAYLVGSNDYKEIDDTYDTANKVKRIQSVLKLLKHSETPTIKRAWSFLRNIVAASGGSVAAGRQALKDGANGLQKLAVLRSFGRGYRLFARSLIEKRFKSGANKSAWKIVDKPLVNACLALTEEAKTEPHCAPGTYR